MVAASDQVKKTPLFHLHEKLNAKMVEFGGWLMPVQYSGIIAEHQSVRTNAGIFDISHMGWLEFSGKDTFKVLQRLLTRNISTLQDGRAYYTVMCSEQGGIVDDVIVYRRTQELYFLVVNASTTLKDYQWCLKNSNGFDCQVKNRSNEFVLFALQGPKAVQIIEKLTSYPVAQLKRYGFAQTNVGETFCTVMRSGYTGEDGFEICASVDRAEPLWETLLDAGREHGLLPCGLGARDTLRLEACYLLYGNDMNEETTPVEADMEWVVSYEKDFIGKEALISQKHSGAGKKLVAFEMKEPGVPRHDYKVFFNGEVCGKVTSGTFGPTIRKNVGFAFVPASCSVGDEIGIEIHGNQKLARIVQKPFYKSSKQ